MSRRSLISEALASAPEEAPKGAEATGVPRPSFTSKRLEAFGEAARMVKRPTIRLKPSECTIWPGNARDYSLLSEDRLRSLIDSIMAEGGNRIPVVIRRRPEGEEIRYELVTGTRRHWAIAWLNSHHFPNIELVAIIEDLDDEAAFRLADIENREREDISDLERGLNYKAAVDAYYDGIQLRMSERLKISKSTLARYIALTEIPPVIISAFNSPMDLHIKHGEKLVPALKNPNLRVLMEEEARSIAAEQSFRQSGDEEPVSGSEVVQRLMSVCVTKAPKPQKSMIASTSGRPVGQIDRDLKRSLTITITATDLSADDILEALRPTIERAKLLRGARS
jgi:ParB family chromosome partitioning protein